MDVLHDQSHRTWLQIGNKYESIVPPYVMQYTLPEKEAASQIEDELFADPTRRLFPIDSPAATWLSAAYFLKSSAALPYKPIEATIVRERIEKAASVFGILEDVKKLETAVGAESGAEKQAEDNDENYGWVMRSAETGQVIARKYPMFDTRGVKMAADYFDENRHNYPPAVRKTIAVNIMHKAAEMGLSTDDIRSSVLREAGYGIPRKDVLMEEILERAYLTKDAESAILLANINEMVANMPNEEIGQNLDKIAEVIDAFDRSTGLDKYYGAKILMPADFLYDVTLKTAEEALADAVELHQHVFSLSKLAELPPSVFESVLGEDFAKSVTKAGAQTIDKEKLADNLYSLPKPDKVALEEHLSGLFA